ILETNYHTEVENLPGLVNPGESRGTAWGTLHVAMAVWATPASTPNWLNSQVHWQQNLNDNWTFLQRYVNSPSKISTVFYKFPRTDWNDGFMDDYLAIALAWIARMFPSWNTANGYQWYMNGIMPFTSDTSGWLKGWPTPYQYTMYRSWAVAPGARNYLSD